jgi:hypothetical protein
LISTPAAQAAEGAVAMAPLFVGLVAHGVCIRSGALAVDGGAGTPRPSLLACVEYTPSLMRSLHKPTLRTVMLTACVATSGCISGFKHPLSPPAQAYIDNRLIGSWSCVTEDEKPLGLSFAKFDSRQYYLRIADPTSTPDDARAFATRLEERDFLNVHSIGPKASDEWNLSQYSFTESGQLKLKYVDPEPFEDVLDDPQAVRDRLVSRLEDPEVVQDFVTCTRRDADQAQSGR